jgi:hypothetical protein
LRTITRLKDGFGEGQILYTAMKGEGADGTIYVFTYSQGSTIQVSPGLVQTFEVNYALIGRGSAPDLHLHELFHVTFDPNGQMTILNHDLSVTC